MAERVVALDGEELAEPPEPTSAPRLARHTFELSNGHQVGLAVCGRGVPLVVVHGFTAEGFFYAQTLNRLVRRGFKVIAVDMAGHGASQGLPTTFSRLGDYSELMSTCVRELGIRRAVLAGHSMGGRVVAGLGASHPDQVIALLLLDAIVGDEWDRMVTFFRFSPPLLAALGVALAVDTASTLPVLRDPSQALKLSRLVGPTALGHVLQPWRLAGPAYSILASRGSAAILEELAAQDVPTIVVTGDRDLIVPPRTARSAARRARAELVEVLGAGHSWLLKDPETFPSIIDDLLERSLGAAIRASITAAGAATVDDLEACFYEPGAPILALTPALPAALAAAGPPEPVRPARYQWRVTEPPIP